MSFTADAWEATAGIRAAIDAHPFLTGLRDGTLPAEVFRGYLAQDALYLVSYARALAGAAAQSVEPDDVAEWAAAAHQAVVVERALHEAHLVGAAAVDASPTCLAYTSYLSALAGEGAQPVLVAGLLPCFWIYDDVGRRLLAEVGGAGAGGGAGALAGHPYGQWIATYGDPDFTAATGRVRRMCDRLAEQSGPRVRERMLAAFTTASRYEWMFWDAAWRRETWPV